MKKLMLAVALVLPGSGLADGVPVPTPKSSDPYDEDLLKVFKPVVELNGDVSRRRQAVTRLAKIADRLHHLVMALTSALKDPDEVVRLKAAEALADIGPSARDAVPDLVNSLDDANEDVRDWSARALAAIGPPLIYWAATNKY